MQRLQMRDAVNGDLLASLPTVLIPQDAPDVKWMGVTNVTAGKCIIDWVRWPSNPPVDPKESVLEELTQCQEIITQKKAALAEMMALPQSGPAAGYVKSAIASIEAEIASHTRAASSGKPAAATLRLKRTHELNRESDRVSKAQAGKTKAEARQAEVLTALDAQIKALQDKKAAYTAVTQLCATKFDEANAAAAQRHLRRLEAIDALAAGDATQAPDEQEEEDGMDAETYEMAPIYSKEVAWSATELPAIGMKDLAEGELASLQLLVASLQTWLSSPSHMAFTYWEFFCGPADCGPQLMTMAKLVGDSIWAKLYGTSNVHGTDIVPAILRPILAAALTQLDVSLKCNSAAASTAFQVKSTESFAKIQGSWEKRRAAAAVKKTGKIKAGAAAAATTKSPHSSSQRTHV